MSKCIHHGQLCKISGCDRVAVHGGMCNAHYRRVLRNGSPGIKAFKGRHGTGTIKPNGYRVISRYHQNYYEHILITEKALGKKLPRGAIVHHMNEDPQDNHTPFNLVICPNQAYHMLLHRRMRAYILEHGEWK